MYTQQTKPKETKRGAQVVQKKNNVKQAFGFVDNRSGVMAQQKLQKLANDSLYSIQLRSMHKMINNSQQTKDIYQFKSTSNTDVIQMVRWQWDGEKWISQDESLGAGPRRPGAYVGEIADYEEPKIPLSLNLGAGQNPMLNPGTINLEYSEEDASEGKKKNPLAEYIVADATNLPFRSGVFDLIHAINPYGFNPVNPEVSRVMTPSGGLRVTGNSKNKYAKNSGSAQVSPSSVGLHEHGISDMVTEHQFGTQSHTGGGSQLDISSSKTRSYSKGKGITISEAATSENKEL
ncbi:class I SAM-dependent methyltransferase [Tenacibaculum sp. TC6]|uniref:class I SAM-dependent methyltransferase n=1 Tax=Tenacibaculum sp. TC6 TaxID=3423223 RepID=UPI003D35EB95